MIPFSRAWRRRRLLRRTDLDSVRWNDICSGVPLLHGLSEDESRRLRDLFVLFTHEKRVEGCGGMQLTERVRTLIAVQACLIVLELGIDAYCGFDTVLVYPREFRTRFSFEDEVGLVHEEDSSALGEAWPSGPVVLSWEDLQPCDDDVEDGFNLVVHEFAHKLDMLSGDEDGVPPLHSGMDAELWRRTFDEAIADIERTCGRGGEPAVDPYAAESNAECFAVFSETFFQVPLLLRDAYPAAYDQLRAFYLQDPAARFYLGSSISGR